MDFLQQSSVKPAEMLPYLGIMRTQLRVPLKLLVHECNMVPRYLRGSLNWVPVIPRGEQPLRGLMIKVALMTATKIAAHPSRVHYTADFRAFQHLNPIATIFSQAKNARI